MSATEFTLDERNLKFMLFEQLKIQELCELEPYKELDQSQFEMIVDEAYKFAKNVAAPINGPADKEGCRFEDGKVIAPKGFKELYDSFCEMGWLAMAGDPEYGGQGLPMAIAIPAGGMFTGSNCSFSLYALLTSGAAHVLEDFASDELKNKYIPNMYTGQWSGTMVLTEPNAGSDVGNSRATAEKLDDGTYKIRGSKIFISSGDHDLSENIVHLVLARVKGAQAGTKGLSLFAVPKYIVNDDGSLGDFNDVTCTGIEHKMGIKASATCSLSFGDENNCIGEIIGDEGNGMRIMFSMMNEARIDCGVQGAAQSSAAFRNALTYAQERMQGSSIKDFKNADAPRVPISSHPDVRRMLLSMKAHTEGMNSLLAFTSMLIDKSKHEPDEEKRRLASGWVELLTPVCKAYCSDKGFEMCSLAVQVFGGYGYCGEYPVEQYLRDVRIASIYEGTNGIQAMDLLGRKLPMGAGAVFRGFLDMIEKQCKAVAEHEELADLGTKLKKAVETLGMAGGMLAYRGMNKDLEGSLLWALPMLYAFGEVIIGHQLLWAADIAAKKLAEGGLNEAEERFYKGKVASAKYFINVELPKVEAHNKAIQDGDRTALEIEFEQLGETA